MYSSVFILVICAYASSASDDLDLNLDIFEGLERCFYGLNESRCEYNDIKVSYNLYTGNGQFRQLNSRDSSQCPDHRYPVKIIIHGWSNSVNKQWVKDMANAYFQKGPINVIAVDWSELAKRDTYFPSAVNTICVGNMVGEFILNYLEPCKIRSENIHIIGHSLGAHLAGFVGKKVAKEIQPRKIFRISGLDMAGLCFFTQKPDKRLYKGDARIVDVYHTDPLIGFNDAVGNYDFYINGGVAPQPGCIEMDNKNITDEFLKGVLWCSHERAIEYFIESITSDKFIASKYEWQNGHFTITGPNAIMGENLSIASPHGLYYIQTNSKPPYALSA